MHLASRDWGGTGLRSTLALAGITLLVSGGLAVTATSVSAAPPAAPSTSLLADAGAALKEHAGAVKGSAADDYQVYSSKKDATGNGVVRYTRTYHGLRVYGGDFIIRVDAKGRFTGASVGLAAPLRLAVTPKVSAAKARATARTAFSGKVSSTGPAELLVDAGNGAPVLAVQWHPEWKTERNPQSQAFFQVFGRALRGALLDPLIPANAGTQMAER